MKRSLWQAWESEHRRGRGPMNRGKDNNYADQYSSNEDEKRTYIRESPGNRMQKPWGHGCGGHKERNVESSERTHVSNECIGTNREYF